MTTIEDKIKLFTKLTYEKIQEEKKSEIDEFNNRKKEVVKEEKEKLKLLEEKEIREISKKADLKANEIIAKAKNKNHQDLLSIKEDLIDKIYKDVMERLEKYTETKEYKDLLIKIVKATVEGLDKQKYNLYLSKHDYERYSQDINKTLEDYKDLVVEVQVAPMEMIGGVIIEDEEKKFRINNSLYSKLEDSVSDIGLKVTESIGK